MKISKNELRKMIFETVLREQANSNKRKEKKEERKAAKKAASAPAPAASAPAPAAPAPAPAAPAAASKKPSKPPSDKIKQVQRLLNSFLAEGDTQLQVNGFWNSREMDPAMEKVMTVFGVKNPQDSWVKMAPILKVAPTLQGLIEYLKEKETGNAQVTVSDDTPEESSLEASDSSDESSSDESDASNEIDPTNAAKFKSAKALADKTTVGAEDMRRIHSRIYEIWKTGLFDKIKSRNANEAGDNDLRKALTTVFGGKNESIKFLRYFGTAGAAPAEKISFLLAKGPMTKNMKDAKPETESFSVLVNDVKRMLEGLNPEYKIGGNGEYVNESKVTYGKSHGTLIRERYWGRY